VPLSDAATAILTTLRGDRAVDPNGYIFEGSDGGLIAQNGMMRVMKKLWPEIPDICVHGFRSAFDDWSSDCTDASEETIEFSLAHVKRGVAARYRRKTAVEKRRILMGQWANHCTSATVVPFKRKRLTAPA
jgi:integrase